MPRDYRPELVVHRPLNDLTSGGVDYEPRAAQVIGDDTVGDAALEPKGVSKLAEE